MRPVRDSLMLLSRSPVGRRLVRTFVPGERVDDAVRAVAEVRRAGFRAGVERLGAPGGSEVAEYRTLLDRLSDAGLAAGTDVTVGVAAPDDASKICRTAAAAGATITIGGAPAHTDVDARLALVAALRADFPDVGVVLHAALPRTEDDCRALAGAGSRVRLERGVDAADAEVDQAYVRCLKVLLGGAGHPVVTTHDPRLLGDRPSRWRAATAARPRRTSSSSGTASARPSSAASPGPASRSACCCRTEPTGTATWWERVAERPAHLSLVADVVDPQEVSEQTVSEKRTAVIGAGVMGETLLSGLIRAGRSADRLVVVEKRPERAAELAEKYGVSVVDEVRAAAEADTVLLVVKPQDMADVLAELGPALAPGKLLVSLAAGITTGFVESRVPDGVAVVRVMPNTPALVDEGMAAISPGTHCDDSHLAEAEELMASVGRVVRGAGEAAGRGHRDQWLPSGLRLLSSWSR
ncbi:pyrroline-5-carboxylate reductase family protein [Pimelobacter simplex]|uniref:pyrroline-5-carboxylate reductase family protein n=1 Tax=Nocardioides simplex TaxID=2045 RepID=UPI0020B1311A|nr:NAD(P)-binding domain-containing protein [Pimelobacter simplex]